MKAMVGININVWEINQIREGISREFDLAKAK
jgi:hypothetical protein